MISETFEDFQNLLPETRELGIKMINDLDFQYLVVQYNNFLGKAANDNIIPQTYPLLEAIIFVSSPKVRDMLQCWIKCNKDMTLTKLTYLDGVQYGTKDQ